MDSSKGCGDGIDVALGALADGIAAGLTLDLDPSRYIPSEHYSPTSYFKVNMFRQWHPPTVKKFKVLKVLKGLASDFFETSEYPKEMLYFPTKFISKKLVETALVLTTYKNGHSDRETVEAALDKAEEFLKKFDENCCDQEYMTGFEFVMEGLRERMKFLVQNDGQDQEEELTGNCGQELAVKGQRDELSVKSEVAVMAVKQFFIGLVKGESFPEQRDILVKMIELDPDYYEWHYRLHRIIQSERRNVGLGLESGGKGGKHVPPGIEEIDLIQKAYNLSPKNADVLLTYCHCLAEVLRYHSDEGGMISFGSLKKFSGVGHMTKFLRQEAETILLLDPVCLKFSLGVGSIYSSALPHCYRDSRFARQCYDRALIFHPRNARAIVRRGFYTLIIERNSEIAQSYFEMANNIDRRDFAALTSLLYIYFQHRVKNEDIVEEILEEQLVSSFWNSEQLAELQFIKGLYAFLNDINAAGTAWIAAYRKDKAELGRCFLRLVYLRKKYSWPSVYDDLICLPTFYKRIKLLFPMVGKNSLETVKSIRALIKIAGRLEEAKIYEGITGKLEKERNADERMRFGVPHEVKIGHRIIIPPIVAPTPESYAALEVKDGASAAEIKEAYYRIVKESHPVLREGLSKEAVEEKYKRFRTVHSALGQLI